MPILYVNGTANSLNYRNTVTDHGTTSQNFKIGNTLNNNYSAGLIDQVRVFNTELTQSQVTTLARGIATSYSGSATNVNFNGSLNFQPDLVWVKARDAAHDHVLVNSINGAGSNQGLSSNATYYNGEYTATYGYISSLDSNGFTVSAGSSYANYTNVNNEDYVSWNWKAGGAAVSNNNGTLTSTVNVNQSAGFSIVKYTPPSGGSVYTNTVGHGLSSAPEIIIQRMVSNTGDWYVHTSLIDGSNDYLVLNSSAAKADNPHNFAVTSTTFTDWGWNGNEMINYCWHSVAGYSKIGSYSGTSGNTIVYTTDDGTSGGSNPFQPSFVMIKKTNSSSNANWVILDAARGSNTLFPDLASGEDVRSGLITYNSDNFTLTQAGSVSQVNNNSDSYLYMAFA